MKTKKFLFIKADTNDADYVESMGLVSDKQLEKFMPLIEAIKNFKPYKTKTEDGEMDWTHDHNWPDSEYNRDDLGEKPVNEIYKDVVSEDVLEEFRDFVPYGEHGVHTIESIKVYEVSNVKELL
jgi:hypothetical protein